MTGGENGSDGDGFEETHGWLLTLKLGLCGSMVHRRATRLAVYSVAVALSSLPIACAMWQAGHRRSSRRYALSQAFPTSVPVMHGPVLPILIIGLGLAGVVLARVLLLPFAKAVQARQGYSDQFVTDLALALPLSAFILGAVAGLIWLVR